MITNCILTWALILNNFAIGITPTVDDFTNIKDCQNQVPEVCMQYAQLLVKHFDVENIEIATKVMWCESRGKTNAYRYEDDDSGLFQIIPRSYGWVKQNYDVPHWDYPINGSYAQFIPKYNIEVASILVEDIHSRNPYWKVFSSSQWCWEDTDKWIAKWKNENT